ncbi:MAG: hypothetical protein ACUZ8I_05510 [Candidatus Scalindua sp.]
MILLISRIILTIFLSYLIFLVWTKNVDLLSWARNKTEGILPIAEDKVPQLLFSLSVDLGLGLVDTKEYTDEEPKTWNKASLQYRLSLLTSTPQWSANTIVGMIFYSADRLYKTESDLPLWITESVNFGEKPGHHRVLHHTVKLGQVNSARPSVTDKMNAALSVNNTPWNAAIYVLAENKSPQWYQLTIKKGNPKLIPKSGSGVQVRNYKLVKVDRPDVSAGYETCWSKIITLKSFLSVYICENLRPISS